MKRLLFLLVLLAMFATPIFAGEKEELTAQLSALQWEAQAIQQRMALIQIQAQELAKKLEAIKAKEPAKPEVKKGEVKK
jgi:uncharacterized protein (DUF3084 family)